MSIQMVLLPVFVLVGLTFRAAAVDGRGARGALVGGETKIRDIALGSRTGPPAPPRSAIATRNQFELPLLFYILIALALPCGMPIS